MFRFAVAITEFCKYVRTTTFLETNAYDSIRKQAFRDSLVAQRWLLLVTPSAHIQEHFPVTAAPPLIQLPANAPGNAAGCGLCAWAPATHRGNLDAVPGSCLPTGPDLFVEAIWRVK